MNQQQVIETSHLCRTFGDGETLVKAVDDISTSIKYGEFVALMGPSGSGKSTFLNLVSGLDQPSSGTIKLGGRMIHNMSEKDLSEFRRDHIGFIFQTYNLIPVLTAIENVEYILLLQGIASDERLQRSFAMLKKVGLAGKENQFPNQLSGGQQQRVAIARAMVSNPNIILADEPTANLDSHTGSQILEIMQELNEEGMTFLFSTHDPMIMERSKRLITLRDGQLVGDELRVHNQL